MTSDNTWPGGQRKALTQDDHERWNASHFPGTKQLCIDCDEPTGRCEEDAPYFHDHGPLCEECHDTLDMTELEKN